MPVFNIEGKKILFIHVPKTGGTSIENWLSKIGDISFYNPLQPDFLKITPQHLTYADLKLLFNKMEFDLAFTIVRDPYTKLESEYFYKTESQMKRLNQRPDFSGWLVNQLEKFKKNKFHFDNHLRLQTDFLDNELSIFKYEDGLDKVVKHINGSLKIKKSSTLKNLNVSNRNKKVRWSVEARNLVNSIYKTDFEQLKYKVIKPKLKIKK